VASSALDRVNSAYAGRVAGRDNETTAISVYDWAKMWRPGQNVTYRGTPYTAWQVGSSGGANAGLYDGNSVVFACEAKRIMVFSEARFQFQQLRSGRPGDLFGTTALGPLEKPWIGHTTRDLLVRAELDVADAGNSYWVADGDYLLRLDPACMKIVTEAAVDPVSGFRVGERLIGYAYMTSRDQVTIYDPTEVAHYKPIPHTASQFLGMSWLNPCLPDVDADQQMTEHKRVGLRNGANLGYVVSLDASVTPEQLSAFVTQFREQHDGPGNAGKTLFLGGGADVKTVGQSFNDLALKATQGATETRIAACAGVHPVVVGLSEGMQGSSLNAGNYGAAKRNFVDGTMRPLWGAFASAFGSLISPPTGSRLWYDDRDIPFLREDVTDQAEIRFRDAQTIRALVDAGYEPDAVIEFVDSGDITRLSGNHSGLYSVQLQRPGEAAPKPTEAP